MSDVLYLFYEDPQKSSSGAPTEPPIADWQVYLLRKAPDARRLITQAGRKAAAERRDTSEVSDQEFIVAPGLRIGREDERNDLTTATQRAPSRDP